MLAEVEDENGNRELISYTDEVEGKIIYDDPETGSLEGLVSHLRDRKVYGTTFDENTLRLREIAHQRALAEGKSLEQIIAEQESRVNVARGTVGVDAFEE